MKRQNGGIGGQELKQLFRQHLEHHHHIETGHDFETGLIREHLEGEHTLIPVTVFLNKNLSVLEAIVKYLRENELLRNSDIARILGKSPASVWITYRNAMAKFVKRLSVEKSDVFILTSVISANGLSVLESVSMYLHEAYGFSYRRIGELLNRDERTIWTVCNRARKKRVVVAR